MGLPSDTGVELGTLFPGGPFVSETYPKPKDELKLLIKALFTDFKDQFGSFDFSTLINLTETNQEDVGKFALLRKILDLLKKTDATEADVFALVKDRLLNTSDPVEVMDCVSVQGGGGAIYVTTQSGADIGYLLEGDQLSPLELKPQHQLPTTSQRRDGMRRVVLTNPTSGQRYLFTLDVSFHLIAFVGKWDGAGNEESNWSEIGEEGVLQIQRKTA